MDARRALLVDAFTAEPLAGNAAGVIPDAAGLSADRMAAVARELSVSETAFVRHSDAADRRLRYFTPTREIDLCGHATIAAHAHLAADGAIDAGTHTIETGAGVIDVEVTADGVVWMSQNPPTVEPVAADTDRIADALGIDPAGLRGIAEDLPVAVASTGLPFLVVPVTYLEHLGDADPDDDAVAALSTEYDAAGVYAFTFDALASDSTLHARAFAPAIGIPEDPVTGTASGACGAYLRRTGAFDGDFPDDLRFEQGHFLDRPGIVRVAIESDENRGDGTDSDPDLRVRVGGRAATALDGTVRIPDDGDDGEDGIIEA